MQIRNAGRALCGLLFMSAWVFALLAFSPAALASSNPITVTARTYSLHFPTSIDFQATARDNSSSINQATIYITFGAAGYLEHYNIPITPAKSVALSWRENTSSSNNFVSPGTPVTYYWQLQDSAGHSYTDAQQHFLLVDSRFSWQHLSKGTVQVDWYNRPLDFGQFMLDQASKDVNRISTLLGGSLSSPVTLWIYQNDSDFHGALAPDDYEWVGGQAFTDLNEAMIVVSNPSDPAVNRDMPHELTHLIFGQLTVHANDIPAWFNEGLAVYNQFYHEPDLTARLQEALADRTLLRLDIISGGFPDDPNQAYLAYAQSWNLVSYMYSTFGHTRMGKLIQTMSSPLIDFNDSLKQALGVDQLHLENQWRLSLHQPPVINTGSQPSSSSSGQTPATGSTASLPLIVGIALILIALASISMIFFSKRRRLVPTPASRVPIQPASTHRKAEELQNTKEEQPLQANTSNQYREYVTPAHREQPPQASQE